MSRDICSLGLIPDYRQPVKHAIILILLSIVNGDYSFSQNFERKDFVNTKWFTDNSDSSFFKSDTLRFIQYTNVAPEVKNEFSEYEMKYLNHGEYCTLELNRFGTFRFEKIHKNYLHSFEIAEFTWKFDKRENMLTLYREDEMFLKLKVVSRREIEIESRFAEHKKPLTTKEITLIRVKNKLQP